MDDDALDDVLDEAPYESRSARDFLEQQPRTKRRPCAVSLSVAREPLPEDRYYPRKISFQLDAHTARGIQRLRVILAEDRALQRNGRNVQSVHDAVRYLVEQFVEAQDDGINRTRKSAKSKNSSE